MYKLWTKSILLASVAMYKICAAADSDLELPVRLMVAFLFVFGVVGSVNTAGDDSVVD